MPKAQPSARKIEMEGPLKILKPKGYHSHFRRSKLVKKSGRSVRQRSYGSLVYDLRRPRTGLLKGPSDNESSRGEGGAEIRLLRYTVFQKEQQRWRSNRMDQDEAIHDILFRSLNTAGRVQRKASSAARGGARSLGQLHFWAGEYGRARPR